MIENLPSRHLQIARQIAALERAVLAFQPVMVGATGMPGAIDTNLAIILSARLAKVWKRVGTTIPRGHVSRRRNGGGTAWVIAR
jgi:hypothetical protein